MKGETQEVALELLVGRRVHDIDGRPAGRIEEVRGERIAEECYIREYLLGPAALLERFAVRLAGLRFARAFGIKPKPPRVATWELIVIASPEKPRLLCRPDQLPRDKA